MAAFGCSGPEALGHVATDKPGGLRQVISSVRGSVSSYIMEIIIPTSWA